MKKKKKIDWALLCFQRGEESCLCTELHRRHPMFCPGWCQNIILIDVRRTFWSMSEDNFAKTTFRSDPTWAHCGLSRSPIGTLWIGRSPLLQADAHLMMMRRPPDNKYGNGIEKKRNQTLLLFFYCFSTSQYLCCSVFLFSVFLRLSHFPRLCTMIYCPTVIWFLC